MASAANAAGSNELKQVGVQEESNRKYVAWLCLFAFGTGCVTVELIHDLHNKSNQVWSDLPILLTCLVFVRRCASRLWKRS
jgi:hypothetical protein